MANFDAMAERARAAAAGSFLLGVAKGYVFDHSKWLDAKTSKPLRCIVTKVANGCIYYRPLEGGGAPMHCAREYFIDYVLLDDAGE